MAALEPVAEDDPRVQEAAEWLYSNPSHPRPTIPALREKFGLMAPAATAAIRRSHELFRDAMREAREHEDPT